MTHWWLLMNFDVSKSLFGPGVFRDERTLSPEYVPESLPRREDEMARLARDLRPILQEGSFPVQIAVLGGPGFGKTATVKRTMEEITREASERGYSIFFSYYNCHTTRSKTAILRHLLGSKFNISARGFSDEEVLEMMMKRLEKTNSHLVLALDESYMLDSNDVLSLVHAAEFFGPGKARISLILISRPTEWSHTLKDKLSEYLHDQIDVKGYTKEDLVEILTYRAELAFKPGVVSPDITDMVAEIASQTMNARHGIEILHSAGRIADLEGKSEITAEMIREGKANVYPELRTTALEQLNLYEKLAALGISRRLKHKGVTSTTIKEGYHYFKIACEEHGQKPQNESAYREYIDQLNKIGIIEKIVKPIGKGKPGRRARITIFDIPAIVLEEKITKLIEEELEKQ